MFVQVNSICIIDDDEIYTLLLKKTIAKLKITDNIITFLNGKVALDNLAASVAEGLVLPDVILLDINMPICDGWMFLEEFKAIKTDGKSTTDIYIVSSSIANNDREKASFYTEIKDYIIKPVASETMLKIVETHRLSQLE